MKSQVDTAPSSASDDRPSRIAMMGRLLKLSNMVMRPFFAYFADRLSINHNELRVLMILAPLHEAAAHEIAKAAGMYPMNVSRAVATLMRAGRIEARRDTDGRRKILSLTPKGYALYEALLPHVRYMSDLLFETMTQLETEFFGKLLAKLVERLDNAAQFDATLLVPPSESETPSAKSLQEEIVKATPSRGKSTKAKAGTKTKRKTTKKRAVAS